MLGPPATTLVRYGAKYAGLIVYQKQWWRLISPMALHAGVPMCDQTLPLSIQQQHYYNMPYLCFIIHIIYTENLNLLYVILALTELITPTYPLPSQHYHAGVFQFLCNISSPHLTPFRLLPTFPILSCRSISHPL